MAVEQEIWRRDILGYIEDNNQFLQFSVDASGEVLNGKVVHIPQAGDPSAVVKNRSTLPGTVVRRGDGDVTYALDSYTVDPTLVRNLEEAETNYEKRQSILRDNAANLTDIVGDDLLYNWAVNLPLADQLEATGSTVSVSIGGSTVSLKGIQESDIIEAEAFAKRQKTWKRDGWYMAIDPDNLKALKLEMKDRFHYRDTVDLPSGVVTRLHGFWIIERSRVLILDNTGAVKPADAAIIATDVPAAFFWHDMAVERAIGDIVTFDNQRRAEYYGDVISHEVRMGGRARRGEATIDNPNPIDAPAGTITVGDNQGIGIIKMVTP